MLDKDAQKSLLDNAAEVNKTILAVCQANVKEYTDKIKSFTDPNSKVTDENAKALHMETFGKEARQSLNIKTLLDLPGMEKKAIEKVIEIMNDREKEDAVVEEKLEIAKETSTASSTFRPDRSLQDLLGGDYIKDGNLITVVENDGKEIAFILKIKSNRKTDKKKHITFMYSFVDGKLGAKVISDEDFTAENEKARPIKSHEKETAVYKSIMKNLEMDEHYIAWKNSKEPISVTPQDGTNDADFTFDKQEASYTSFTADSFATFVNNSDTDYEAFSKADNDTEAVTIYFPARKNSNELVYLYVTGNEDYVVKTSSKNQIPNDASEHVFGEPETDEYLAEHNPKFYEYWKSNQWATNDIGSEEEDEETGETGENSDRGEENILTILAETSNTVYKGKNTIPVGAFVRPNTPIEPGTAGDIYKYSIVISSGAHLKLKKNGDHNIDVPNERDKIAMDYSGFLGWLDHGDNSVRNFKIFNGILASNPVLAAKFKIVARTDLEVKTE